MSQPALGVSNLLLACVNLLSVYVNFSLSVYFVSCGLTSNKTQVNFVPVQVDRYLTYVTYTWAQVNFVVAGRRVSEAEPICLQII